MLIPNNNQTFISDLFVVCLKNFYIKYELLGFYALQTEKKKHQ